MKSKNLNIRISPEADELLRKLAAEETRSPSNLIEKLIKDYARQKKLKK
jgi:hypothetical protein